MNRVAGLTGMETHADPHSAESLDASVEALLHEMKETFEKLDAQLREPEQAATPPMDPNAPIGDTGTQDAAAAPAAPAADPLASLEAPLADLASEIKGGVVMAPKAMRLPAMIKSLEKQLPWLH